MRTKFDNINKFIFILLICLVTAVKSEGKPPKYNVEINYINSMLDEVCYCADKSSNDSLLVIIGAGFTNDTIEIILNDKIVFFDVVTTCRTSAVTTQTYLDKFKNIEEFYISVNGSRKIMVVTESECCLVGINFRSQNTIIVNFYCNFIV